MEFLLAGRSRASHGPPLAPALLGQKQCARAASEQLRGDLVRRCLVVCLLSVLSAVAQSNDGELRLKVTDPAGLGVKCPVELLSEANQYHDQLTTDDDGTLVAKRLAYGLYQVRIQVVGFAPVSESIDIRSAVPSNLALSLAVASVSTSVTVSDSGTLIDPYRAGSVNQIGSEMIQNRLSSLPGRSLQDLVNSQPGWLYEGNAVLHPRGSEYQTQFVVDGIPLMDNRSPAFGTEIEADDVESLKIYTAGIPAEFGRKMGGVVEVNTLRDAQPGLHGQIGLTGGSFDTGGSYGRVQYSWGQNTLRRQRHRQHDRPLSEPGGSRELHQQRHHRKLLPPTTSANLRRKTA